MTLESDRKIDVRLVKLLIAFHVLLRFGSSAANEDGMTVSLASVCSGDQLNLTCQATQSETLIQWSLAIPSRTGSELRFISSNGNTASVTPLIVGQTVFQFLRTSTLPLTSLMVIDNVSSDVNGTRVECSYGGGVVSTIINVIGNGTTPPMPVVEVTVGSVQFENETVVVALEWTVENGAFSSLIVVPEAEAVNLGPSSRQLMLSYNTSYNISAVASLCRQYTSHSLQLHYVKCVSPLRLLTEANNQLVMVNYSYPAIAGTTAVFNCSRSGYELTGPQLATCTGNGEWVPDPKQVQCQAIDCGRPSVNMNVNSTYNSTSFNARLTLTCAKDLLPSGVPSAQCLSNGSWSPDPTEFTCKLKNTSEPQQDVTHAGSNNSGAAGTSTDAIIGGALVGVLFLFGLVIIFVIIIIIIIRKGSLIKDNKPQNGSGRQINDQEFLPSNEEGEYSLLQHSLPQPDTGEHSTHDEGTSSHNLVYADLGPAPMKKKHLVPIHDNRDDQVEYAQLNYHAKNREVLVAKNNKHSADNSLDLDRLLLQIKSKVTPKWYEFGIALGIGKELLEKCVQYSPEESIIEVCDHWLRNCAGQPTWSKVAKALKKSGFQKLASDIEKVYETGELPVDIRESHEVSLSFDDSLAEPPPPIPPRAPVL